MTDYHAQIKGTFANGRTWTTERNITSAQSEQALANTWANAWTAAWNDAAHGLNVVYPAGLTITEASVATYGVGFTLTSRSPVPLNLVGTDVANSLPTSNSVVIRYFSGKLGHHFQSHQSLPACGEDVVVNDFLTLPARTRFKAAMSAIQTAVGADGSFYFTFNTVPLKNGTPRGDKVTLLQGAFCRDKVGKQSKRYRKEAVSYT